MGLMLIKLSLQGRRVGKLVGKKVGSASEEISPDGRRKEEDL